MKTGYIYEVKNNINNKIYIGQTLYIKRRFKDHKANRYHNPHFKHAISYYGADNFSFSILYSLKLEDEKMLKKILNHLEKFWIMAHSSYNPNKGYNSNYGGRSQSGMKYSKESRQKMANSAKFIHIGKLSGKAKAIDQYDLNNKFIKHWDCIIDVEKTL